MRGWGALARWAPFFDDGGNSPSPWNGAPNGTYAVLAGGNTFTASQSLQVNASRASTPIWNYLAAGRSWQMGIDVANYGGAQDFFVSYYNQRVITDLATTSGSVNVTSALQAQFGPQDNGVAVSGAGIPNGTTLVWASGTDGLTAARLSQSATATATVTATIGTGSTVSDLLYMAANGGNYASFGMGVTPPPNTYRVSIQGGGTGAGANSQGGMTIGQASGNTADLLSLADSGGTQRLRIISDWSVRSAGNAAWGGTLCVQGDDVNNVPLVLIHKTSHSTWSTWWEDNNTLSLRYGGTTQAIQFWNSGGVRMMGSVGFYGTTPKTVQTVTGAKGGNAALASLLTGLATLGLIVDSSSA